MDSNRHYPTRAVAEKLLEEASQENPGPWIDHCRVVARVAETIARKCGLDVEKAYVLGLLHDIGYAEFRDFKGRTSHILLGYERMINAGYDAVARICLTHSFPLKDINVYGGGDRYWSLEEEKFVHDYLNNLEFDDYDKLIQLGDAIGLADGVTLMDKRLLSVLLRHGFGPLTIEKYKSFFEVKSYFDQKCGENIYNFFKEEIINSIFT